MLPLDPVHLAIAVGAGALAAAAAWRAFAGGGPLAPPKRHSREGGPKRHSREGGRIAIALAPLVFVYLPWLPLPVPAAFYLWTGALASLVWIGVALALTALCLGDRRVLGPALAAAFSRPSSAPVAAGAISAIVFALAAWGVSPSLPGGDEPHYLIVTQSLLRDHDLKIENNHQRGDYREYFAGDLAPHSVRRGRNGEIYSIHAPGVPALVLPAFAIGGYRGVVVFLILVSAAGCALAWILAWRTTKSVPAAWFGWAAVTLAAPFLLESFTVFPDGPGAIVVLTGFWALLRTEERQEDSWVAWLLHGVALALLPWMHTRFAVLAGTLGGLILVRIARVPNPLAKAVAFLSVPALSALAWLFFFTIVYGAPDPSAPYGGDTQNSLAYLPDGFGGLLFDQGFGLLATAPVLAFALAGFVRARRLALEWLVVALPYGLAVATYAMWWAGMSGPARFLVPLILPLAIPAACAWAAASRPLRAVMCTALIVTAWLSMVMAGAGGGRLAYHTRNEAGLTAAPWLEWANPLVELPSAVPAFVPQPVQPDPGGLVSRANAVRSGFATTVPWALAFAAAASLLIWFAKPAWRIESLIAAATIAFATAITAASASAWTVHAVQPVTRTSAQLDVLRRLGAGRVAAVGIAPPRRLSPAEAWTMKMDVPVRRLRGLRLNAPLAAFPAVPAGTYEVSVRRRGGDGWMMIGVGNDQFAIVTQPLSAYDAGIRLDLPVDVRALLVRADEGGRAQLDAIELRPVARRAPVSDAIARRAVRYGAAVVFFLDDRAFAEPSGFWVGGARDTSVAVQPDTPRPVGLLLRNGAAANTVTLESGAWRQEIALAAGEEQRVEMPAETPLLRIRSSAGFRPSDVNAASRDTRLLGVFVRVAE